MSNNKSSIEWLIDNYFGGIENCSPMFRRKIAEAKAMHKEEIEQAFYEGNHNSVDYFNMDDFSIKDYEQYYNETYGGNKEP